MKKRLSALMALSALSAIVGCKHVATDAGSAVKYYGADNQRYRLKFSNYFLMDPSTDKSVILDEAHKSLKFLFGVFQWHREFHPHKGIPHGNPKFMVLGTEPVDVEGRPMMKVSYQFDDEIVSKNSLPSGAIEFWMPKDAQAIYDLGEVEGRNRCTDFTYRTRDDFWYFWDPNKAPEKGRDGGVEKFEPGCPESFKTGLVRVNAQLKAIPNDRGTYPEYGRLGTASKRLIYVAQGANVDLSEGDEGAQSFVKGVAQMQALGFQVADRPIDGPEGKHWVLKAKAHGRDVELHYGFFISRSDEFTEFGREGLQNADIFIYNGHSGLGGYLPPSRFTPLALPKKYQVFLFNGCSTFAYYNESYFSLKGRATGRPGTKDLDIVTTGLESYFGVNPFITKSLINNLVMSGANWMWEGLINDLFWQTKNATYGESNQWSMDPVLYSSHFQVNGDEDNPRSVSEALGAESPR